MGDSSNYRQDISHIFGATISCSVTIYYQFWKGDNIMEFGAGEACGPSGPNYFQGIAVVVVIILLLIAMGIVF